MSKANLYMKMLQVMEEVGQIKKDGSVTNASGKKMYDYLSEEQVTGELQQAFIKFKLVVFPIEVVDEFFYIEGQNNSGAYRNPTTRVNVKYKIVDAETGEFEIINSVGQGTDNADKGSNKAMTGAFKYAMRQSFAISTGDDGDHTSSDELTSRNTSAKKPTEAPKQSQPTQTSSGHQNASASQPSGPQAMISEAQAKYAYRLKGEKKIGDDDFRRMVAEYNEGIPDVYQMPKKAASEFINFLNNYAV